MDTQLLEQARRGNRDAAERLIRLHYQTLYAFLRRLAGTDADAADLTQRSFARIWKALPTFAGKSSVSTWMHGIAYHTYVDWLRSNHKTESRDDCWWCSCADPHPSPSEEAASSDLAAAVFGAVDRLEPALRAAVHLRYYQGLKLEEVAAVLEVSGSTVKNRLSEALNALQVHFSEEAPIVPSPSGRRTL